MWTPCMFGNTLTWLVAGPLFLNCKWTVVHVNNMERKIDKNVQESPKNWKQPDERRMRKHQRRRMEIDMRKWGQENEWHINGGCQLYLDDCIPNVMLQASRSHWNSPESPCHLNIYKCLSRWKKIDSKDQEESSNLLIRVLLWLLLSISLIFWKPATTWTIICTIIVICA